MTVRLTVHRSTQEIGGNCIEVVATDGHRLLLDIGRPLDAAREATDLLPATLDLGGARAVILISHPHQDHYGLLQAAPADWPVHCGAATEKLIKLTAAIIGEPITRGFNTWTSGRPFAVGPFTVTPFLTDHSAFDAYMLLIDVEGRRILYSGDFRMHGRKASLVTRFMAAPPPAIDVLLLEGTNLGADKPWMSEGELEAEFRRLFADTHGRVFVAWSAQNVDRTVTLYRACLESGRTLVVDLYTAEVMALLGDHANLPRPGWKQIKVVITSTFADLYRAKGRDAFVARMAEHGIAAHHLNETPSRWVVMTRKSLIRDYAHQNVTPGPDDAWSWSMWRGYLDGDDGQAAKAWFDVNGARACHLHTSGHASPDDLRKFAQAMRAGCVVPIHGAAWDTHAERFAAIRRLRDGEPLVI
ncbi:MAG: MBL fold metallo-hydrolase [Xanthobacteraceae bacterium]|nr:MBL fold metallo-hydrolase [Xanthobacteraceae bacterium]